MRKYYKFIPTILISFILASCSIPAKHNQPPLSAEQLATAELNSQLIDPEKLVSSKPNELLDIEVAPPIAHKQVKQQGTVPNIITLTDNTLNLSDIELADNAKIELDFGQTEIRNIISIIANALDLSFIMDPTINGKVTLRTSPEKPLTKKDLWPLLQLLLNDAGIVMERRGQVYHFKNTPPGLPNVIGMSPRNLITSSSAEVLQVTPLRYISIEAAKTVIEPLIKPQGRTIALATLNIIGIITTPQRLERINKLLQVIDANPFRHRGIRLFRLVNSEAAEVQTELDKILKALYGQSTPIYQVVALERINSILVITPPNSGFDEVAMWISILDERSEGTDEQIFIYKVRNLEASKLESTLSSVFKADDREKNNKKVKNIIGKDTPSPISRPVAAGVSAELKVNIVADESTNSLLIRATPRDYKQLLETIKALDQIPKEVMINLVIAEVSLTEATKFGIDWHALFNNNFSGFSNIEVPTGNFPANIAPSENGGLGSDTATTIGSLAGFSLNYISGSLNALLNIVASNNEVSILSRPSLLVRNNEEAMINVGSNEPFLSGVNSSTVNNQLLSNDVQYKDTGITIKVTPRINDEGIINLKVLGELTLLGPPRTTQNLQSFDQRKIETFVVVRDGTAIVIGGLIQTNDQSKKQGIPILKDLPILGNLIFSSTDIEEKRTELVIIIVPEIVNPAADTRPLVQNFRKRMYLLSKLLNDQNVLTDYK
ncbi:MAG: type II secretion system secretin GspD [Thiomargarita sp.]|nr:type II secretion system secretin GspD [Thiomargarita sp.]